MRVSRKTLVKTISCEEGRLYCTAKGKRTLLSECGSVDMELFQESTTIPAGGRVIDEYFSIVICGDMNFTREINMDFLFAVQSFDLAVDVQREDGVFERVELKNLTPMDLDVENDVWRFEAHEPRETLIKLRNI